MNQLLNTPFMQFAFRWDVLAIFTITAAVLVVMVIGFVVWLFRGVKWR